MQEFLIAPAASRAMWLMLLIPIAIVVLVTVVLGKSILASRSARFEVSSEGLRLRGDLYGRLIPARELRRDEIARVDLSARPELAPRWRTMGTGLPGFQSGWFRLRNGEKALLYLTDRSRAVYVPTTAGYSVLLSPRDPDAFVTALRETAP